MGVSIWKTGTAYVGDALPYAFAVIVVDDHHAHWVERGEAGEDRYVGG